jgi:hypothetical protein
MNRLVLKAVLAVATAVAAAGIAAPAPAHAAPVYWCDPITYTGGIPASGAFTTCSGSTRWWAVLTGKCGSSGVSYITHGEAYQFKRLEIQCYDYATISAVYSSVGRYA